MRNFFQNIHLFNLVAFLAVLVAIVVLALAGKATDLAIMTGLVGVLGSFKPWGSAPIDGQKVEIDQPSDKPVPTTTEDQPA